MSERAERTGGTFWGDVDDDDALRRFRSLVNAVGDGLYQLDGDGRFVAVNDALVEKTGVTRGELQGKHVTTVFPTPDDSTEHDAIERLVDPDGSGEPVSTRLRTADGDVVRCEVRPSPFEEGGERSGAFGVVRERSVNGLEQPESQSPDTGPVVDERLEAVLDTSPTGIVVFDGDGDVVRSNDRARDLLGIPDDADTDAFLDVVAVDEEGRRLSADERLFSRVRETGEPVYGQTMTVERPGGRQRWLSVSVAAVTTGDGGAERFVATYEDVTATQERSHKLEGELDRVLGRISDAFYALDEEFRFVHVNERAEELLGTSADALRGEVLWDAFPETPDTDLHDRLRTAMRTHEADRFERYSEQLGIWEEVHVYPSDSGLSVYFHDITERREMERALRERERQLSTLMDNVPGMVYRCRNDRSWPMEFVSEGCRELTGYEPEAFEAGDLSYGHDVVVEDDRESLWEEIQRGVDDRDPFSVTYRIRTAAGDVRWVRDHGRGVFDDEGELERLEGVIIDVTERKRAQQRLEDERDMFARGPAIVFRWKNEEGWPVEYVSENVEDLLGYTPDELESGEVPFTDLLFDEELDRLEAEVEAITDETTDRFSHEPYRVKTKDGGTRWVRDVTKIVRDGAGEITHFLGYLVDVTERKERERELTKYETIVETINDGIYVKDESERFTMVNEAYAELTGYERDDLIGAHASLVVDEEAIRESRDRRDQAASGPNGAEATMEAAVRTADGALVPAEGTFATLRTDEGETRQVGVVRDISGRKRRERELRQKERRYQAVFEDPNILVGLLEPDGTVLDINQTAMEYIDAGLDDVTGKRFWETPWWGEDEAVRADVEEWTRQAAAGEYVDFEADLTRPGGEQYTLSGYFRPVTNDEGEVVSIIVSDRDITERRKREREVEESERRYRALAENFPNGAVALVDEDVRYRTVGGRPMDIANAPAREIEGKPVAEAVPPALAEELVPRYESALEGESAEFEKDLGNRIYQFRIVPVWDDDGEVFAALGMSQDVTDRHEAKRKLEESERRYRTLVENFPNGAVGLFDEELRYTVVGGAALDDVGTSGEEIIGQTVWGRYPEELADKFEPHFRAALDGETNTFEIEFHGRHWIAYTLPVVDDDGDIFAGMIMVQEITERLEYERKLEASNERLEQFAYAASHDLQEPLRMVSSYLQLIEDRYTHDLDDEGREFLEFAVDGAERMRNMIASLLQYSRVEQQGDPFEQVDLDAVLADVLTDLQFQIEESGAEITADDLPRVEGDPNQLRQLFQNLVDNALEYCGEESPRVYVSVERDGRQWRISVRDEGIGIDPEDQDRIFDVFQRLHTRDEHEGTGVGLALCQRIVERHGGEIRVDSEPGVGTTFTFTLPRVEE